MKKILFVLLLSTSCRNNTKESKAIEYSSELGSLSGNVFYTYNKFVGSRADAGADVYLFDLSDSSKTFSTKVDVSGNFVFDSIPCRGYYLAIASQNVKDNPLSSMRNIESNSTILKGIAGFIPTQKMDSLYERGQYFDSLAHEALFSKTNSPSRALSLHSRYEDSVFALSLLFHKALPSMTRLKTGMRVLTKMYFNIIQVKPKGTEKQIVDFGITYI